MISKLGATGYRAYEAIAELIDNSIDARVDSQRLKVKVNLDSKNKSILVSDNASGMDLETLKNAMTLAYVSENTKTNRLGRYGLGMKTACSSLGENFFIQTKPIGTNEVYECSYNEKEWVDGDKDKWSTFPINVRSDAKLEHGTTIRIEKLKVSMYPNLVGKFATIFGMRYGPLLKEGQLNLWINSVECKLGEPEIIPESKRDFVLKLPSGNTIYGWGALLKKRHAEEYGLNLYKNGRLIKMYDKSLFGREEHAAISRIIGTLNFDHVPTQYNKTDFLRESNEFIEIENTFPEYNEFKELKSEALQPMYVGEISDQTREKVRTITQNFLQQVEDINRNLYPFPQQFEKGRDNKILDHVFNLAGEKERVIVKLSHFDNISLKEIKLGKPIEILINQNSPAYSFSKDKISFINYQVAESISYIMTKKKGESLEGFLKFLDKFANASAIEVKKGRTRAKKVDVKKANEKLLVEELRDVNEFLKKEFNDEDFYFTATSVLGKYLTHIPRVSYYFIYCESGIEEKIQSKLRETPVGEFLAYKMDQKTKFEPKVLDELANLLEITGYNKIIIIRNKDREKTYRKEGSVASLEIALVDLTFEVDKMGLPLPLSDITDIIEELSSFEELRPRRLRRYARARGILDFFKERVR